MIAENEIIDMFSLSNYVGTLKMFYSLIQRIVSPRPALSKLQNYYQVLTAIWEANLVLHWNVLLPKGTFNVNVKAHKTKGHLYKEITI